MRKKQQKQLITGLFSVAGGIGAFFGVRALMSWMKRRSDERLVLAHERQPMMTSGMDYTNRTASGMAAGTGMSQAAAIPATGMKGTADINTEMTGTANRVDWNESRSDMPFDTQHPDMPTAGVSTTGRTEVGENYSSNLQRQGEHDPGAIPTTGRMGVETVEMPRTQDRMGIRDRLGDTNQSSLSGNRWGDSDVVETDQPVPVGSLVGPLVIHLISFRNMLNLLRMRRDTQEAADSNPEQPDVRAGGADAIGSLEASLPEFDRAALISGSLQERIIQMMEHIREMLQNTAMSEDELFRHSDEMSPAICKMLQLIHKAQEDNVTGFEDVMKSYRC